MVRQKAIAGMLLMSWLFVPLASAAQEDSGDSFETPVKAIEIVGQASTVMMRYQHIVAAMDAFERHIALAPTSKLTFRLHKNEIGTETRGVKVHLAGDNIKHPLAIMKYGNISISRNAAALADDANLVVNRKKSALTIESSVISAGLKPGVMRLGDMRLNCEVKKVLRNAGLGFVERTLAKALPAGCANMVMHKERWSNTPFAAYIMRDGERVGHSDGKSVDRVAKTITVPLNDLSWSDDTLIEFLYAPITDVTPLL